MKWPNANHEVYVGAPGKMFHDHIGRTVHQRSFLWVHPAGYEGAWSVSRLRWVPQPELRWRGGDQQAKFHPPGPMHHTQWMGKGLYIMKIFLFWDLFCLTAILLVPLAFCLLDLHPLLEWGSTWNTFLPVIQVPHNNLDLQTFQGYPDKEVICCHNCLCKPSLVFGRAPGWTGAFWWGCGHNDKAQDGDQTQAWEARVLPSLARNPIDSCWAGGVHDQETAEDVEY